MAGKARAAFRLSITGGVLIILNAFFIFIVERALSKYRIPEFSYLALFDGTIGLIIGIVILIGGCMINSEDKNRIMGGSILILIFLLIGLAMGIFTFILAMGIFTFINLEYFLAIGLIGGFGFILGFILSFTGGVLGLTWKPTRRIAETDNLERIRRIESEFEKYESYLKKLENLRGEIGEKTYLRLKEEYVSKVRELEEKLRKLKKPK